MFAAFQFLFHLLSNTIKAFLIFISAILFLWILTFFLFVFCVVVVVVVVVVDDLLPAYTAALASCVL